ncbi:MAG: hypothetical protein R3D62_11960 [Xanthobacteraceae bacterium]
MNFNLEFIKQNPVFQVPIKPVSLLYENDADARMLLDVAHHLGKAGSAARFRRLNVNEFFFDDEAATAGITLQQLLLRCY